MCGQREAVLGPKQNCNAYSETNGWVEVTVNFSWFQDECAAWTKVEQTDKRCDSASIILHQTSILHEDTFYRLHKNLFSPLLSQFEMEHFPIPSQWKWVIQSDQTNPHSERLNVLQSEKAVGVA